MEIWEKLSDNYKKTVLDAAEAGKYQYEGDDGKELIKMLKEMMFIRKQAD